MEEARHNQCITDNSARAKLRQNLNVKEGASTVAHILDAKPSFDPLYLPDLFHQASLEGKEYSKKNEAKKAEERVYNEFNTIQPSLGSRNNPKYMPYTT